MNSSQAPLAVFWSIGIVPVQDWIAEARRSRDLWASSRLLSWMMVRTLAQLKESGAHIEIPKSSQPLQELSLQTFSEALNGTYSFTNRSSGWWNIDLDEAARNLTSLQTGVLEKAWQELMEAVLSKDHFPERFVGRAWKAIGPYLSGTTCPLHLVWCANEGTAADLERGLEEVDALYLAVKRSRSIPAWQGAPVGKCGQCAKREAIGPKQWSDWRVYHDKLQAMPEIGLGYRVDRGERLCPTCLIKRMSGYLGSEDFPSTSRIASGPWRRMIRQATPLERCFEELESAAKKVPGFENDCFPLFYSRTVARRMNDAESDLRELTPPFQEAGGPILRETIEQLEQVNVLRRRLATSINQFSDIEPAFGSALEPCPYLTVFVFDGDGIGELVRKPGSTLPKRLEDFAERINTLLGQDSKDFYLGGDEGLLLAPLAGCLQRARDIRDLWGEVMKEEKFPPTLSMGLAIFDFQRPLSAAIQASRDALRMAKSLKDKNALGVAVQTASGSTWLCVDHWGEGWTRCARAVSMIQERRLASGWAYDVEAFVRGLDENAWNDRVTREAVRAEIRRITSRRKPPSLVDEKAREWLESVWGELSGETWWLERPSPRTLRTEANRLHLVAFLSRHSELAAAAQDGEP